MTNEKNAVHAFWNNAACGEELYLKGDSKTAYFDQLKIRYQLEPYIPLFANFDQWKDKKVLEIGVGLGADHQKFAEIGADLSGIDLTQNAINHTKTRFAQLNLTSNLQVGDAEHLPFKSDHFDLIYSWGVLHHSPDTMKTIEEVWRVLKPGGMIKIMIYHKYSFVGFMLWLRYGLLMLKPWLSLNYLYSNYLESPGTKAYSIKEARKLFSKFNIQKIETVLTHGDLLTSNVGQRHRGLFLTLSKLFWPRFIIRNFFPKNGLFMLISATK